MPATAKRATPLDIRSFHRYRALNQQQEAIMQTAADRPYFYFGYYFYFAGLPAVC
jgi:hypothetical protein